MPEIRTELGLESIPRRGARRRVRTHHPGRLLGPKSALVWGTLDIRVDPHPCPKTTEQVPYEIFISANIQMGAAIDPAQYEIFISTTFRIRGGAC
jgi:hypothetical protein